MAYIGRVTVKAAALCIIALASQAAHAQINTMPPPPPPPLPAPIYVPPPPPIAPPPGGVSATPTGNPGEWVTDDDYPLRALREERQGATGFRLTIGPDGLVTDCTVTSSSGSPDLDATTCSVVTKRARFSPARDAKGVPVVGQYSSRIRWVIPEGSPTGPILIEPVANFETFIVEADGTATNCIATRNGIDVSGNKPDNPCLRGEKFAPFVDAAGKPVRRRVTLNLTVTVTDPNAKIPLPAPRKKKRR